jgi:peptide deformylase
MAILPIILTPEPILRETAQPVETITDELQGLLDDMADTMYDAPGIGLAANQIGRLERVIVMDCAKDGSAAELWKMINPEIIASSEETAKLEEGCLSIPGHHGDVVRPAEVEVRYLGTDGNIHEMQAGGLLAACIQHEIDHLDGVLFIDRLSRLKRDMIWRKVLKETKARL